MDEIKKPVIDVTGVNLHFSEGVPSLSYYLKDIRKYEVLSVEEERDIFNRIKKGDESAKNELITANQRFVLAVAKRFSVGDNIMDLVQVGNIGMLHAMEKFNPNKLGLDGMPVRFLSYAAWFIRREMSAYIISNGLVRKTNNIKTAYKVNKVKNNYYLKNGRYPSNEELCEIMEKEYNIKIKDESYLYDIETKSLNSGYGEESKRDTLEKSSLFNEKSSSENEYESTIEKEQNKYLVGEMLGMLRQRERIILEKLYGINGQEQRTIEEISDELGITRERVRQLKMSSINKLRKLSKSIAV